MKIGQFEIRWIRDRAREARPVADLIDRTGAFAVRNNEPWWLAVHQTIDEAEAETMASARRSTLHPYGCIAAVAAGEGCDLVRQKLLDKRNLALREVMGNAERDKSPQNL